MDPIERELKEALQSVAPKGPAEVQGLTRRIGQEYRRKQRAAGRLLAGYLLAMMIALGLLFGTFFQIQNQKLSLLIAIGILAVLEGTVVIKLWFWIIHEKIAIVRELKLLQLLVVERMPLPQGTPVLLEEDRDLAGVVELDPKSKGWGGRVLLGITWICALAGWIHFAWLSRETVPKDAELYFEKTVTPRSGEETTETFRVEHSKWRFHPVILPERGHAEAQVAVEQDGGGILYRGPVNDSSRMWFGTREPRLPVGLYTIRYKPIRADASFELRIYGVDQPKSELAEPRTSWIMVCTALTIAIPLLFLQSFFLRRIDPELAE